MKIRVFVFAMVLMGSQNLLHAQRYAVLPQLAVGDGWSFDVFITNESLTTANVVVSFYGDNGAPLPVNTGSGILSTTTLSIDSGATKIIRATSTGPVQPGYALLQSPAGSSIRSTLFVRYRSNTQVVTQLGINQQLPFTHYSCAAEVDSSRGINTGMAFAAPVIETAGTLDLAVQLLGLDGKIQRTRTLSLGPGQHTSVFLNEPKLFPGLDNFSGIVMVSAARAFGFLALRLEQSTLGSVAINASPVLGPFFVSAAAISELEPNSTVQQAQLLPLPARVLGRIENTADIDLYSFSAKKGDLIALLVDTQATGSALDPLLTLKSSNGSVIGRNDQNGLLGQNDSFLQTVLPSDGTYYAEVAAASSTVPAAASYHLHLTRVDANLIAPPQITLLSPNTAAQGTTTVVVIQGSNLSGANGIAFSPASDITVSNIQSSPTQVSASLAIGQNAATGARQLTVTTPNGVSNSLSFTVTAIPKIDFINPTSAPQQGTLDLSIFGSNLNGATAVNFSPAEGIAVTNIVASTGKVTASINIASTAPTGPRSLTVVTPSGTSNPVTFTVSPPGPSITSMTPSSLAQGSSDYMVIQGTNLQGALAILFEPATGITVRSLESSSTQVSAIIKVDFTAAVGTRQVKVWTPAPTPTGLSGFTNTVALSITAVSSAAAPRVSTVRFESGLQGSTLNVTLTGSSLSGVNAVNFNPSDGLTVSNIQATSSQVTFALNIAADAMPGYRRLSVNSPAGESNTASYFVVKRGSTPPVISNLNIGKPSNTTLNGQPAKSIDVSFDFTDPDADIIFSGTTNARVTFINTTSGCSRSEANSPFIDKPAVTSGKISFTYVTTSSVTGPLTLTVMLTDASGNASNILSTQPEGWLCRNLNLPPPNPFANDRALKPACFTESTPGHDRLEFV